MADERRDVPNTGEPKRLDSASDAPFPQTASDDLDEIEAKALNNAKSSENLTETAKSLEIVKLVRETRKLRSEVGKIALDAKEAFPEYKRGRLKYLATKMAPYTPLFAVVLTATTLIFQGYIWHSDQRHQTEAHEESQWREAVKNISLKDSDTALVGALGVHSFFASENHPRQARKVAAVLLPHVDDVIGFDTILFDMLDLVDSAAPEDKDIMQGQIIDISKAVFNSQLDRYGVNRGAQHLSLDFRMLRQMLGDDEPPAPILQDDTKHTKAFAAAWKLSSVSTVLQTLWTDKGLSPQGADLGGVVLVGKGSGEREFSKLNFSNLKMAGGAFYKANFMEANFTGADLSRKLISGVNLAAADLRSVEFAGSKWEHTNWWEAKCISTSLLAYLEEIDDTATSENKAAAHKISCH